MIFEKFFTSTGPATAASSERMAIQRTCHRLLFPNAWRYKKSSALVFLRKAFSTFLFY